VSVIQAGSAAEMKAACEAEFPGCDVLLMAAAVADFRPAHPVAHKLKKTTDELPPELELEPTEDILVGLAAARRPGQVVAGFAAEHGEQGVSYGRDKLARKGLDIVVVNDISRGDIGFEADSNEVVIVTADGERSIPRTLKEQVADAVLDAVQRHREEEHGGAGARSAARV
jgi:phosphopantothenoylcysteine decarboxylase/phosphopantothenate--cysteine ligase